MTSTTESSIESHLAIIRQATEAQLAKFAGKYPDVVLEERIRRVNARDIPVSEKKQLVKSLIERAHMKEQEAACCGPATGEELTVTAGEAPPGPAPESIDDMAEALGVSKMLFILLCDFAGVEDPERNPRRTLALIRHGLAKKLLPSIDAAQALHREQSARVKHLSEQTKIDQLLEDYLHQFGEEPTLPRDMEHAEKVMLLEYSLAYGVPLSPLRLSAIHG